jgi:hypothetical protein
MLTRIYKTLAAWFTNSDYQSGLESFIASKNPQSTVEIEYLERVYSTRRAGGML